MSQVLHATSSTESRGGLCLNDVTRLDGQECCAGHASGGLEGVTMQALKCQVMQMEASMWADSIHKLCRQGVRTVHNDHVQLHTVTVQQSYRERTSSIRYVFLTRARSVLAGPLSFFCRMRMAR